MLTKQRLHRRWGGGTACNVCEGSGRGVSGVMCVREVVGGVSGVMCVREVGGGGVYMGGA